MSRPIPNRLAVLTCLVALAATTLVVACDRSSPPAAPTTNAAAAPHHEHKPPHQGCLVELGEEFAHLELVLDPKTGTLTAYSLDGEAEKPIRLPQKEVVIKIAKVTRGQGAQEAVDPALVVTLAAVGNALTGEAVGDTSQFQSSADGLKEVTHFQGTVAAVKTKGQDFKDVAFAYPEGNEVK